MARGSITLGRLARLVGVVGIVLGVSLSQAIASGATSLRGATVGGTSTASSVALEGPCEPRALTSVGDDNRTIHFDGWTLCSLPLPYSLQIAYGRVGGPSSYSPVKRCPNGPSQRDCGLDGISKAVTDTMAGVQRWCMNTIMYRPNASGRTEVLYSLASCVSH